MIILGILTLSLVAMYIYYYSKNELINESNKDKYRIFGPNSVLEMLLAINIITLFYCSYLAFMYTQRSIEMGNIRAGLKHKCPEFHGLRKSITRKIKSVIV